MTERTIPLRSEIADKYKWNAESVFPTPADFDAELKLMPAEFEAFSGYRGHLSEGPATLLSAFRAVETLLSRVLKLYVYASMSSSADTTDQSAARRNGQAQSAIAQAFAAAAFLDPELLEIGEATLQSWLDQEPALGIYAHYIENLFRKQAHIRSTEVEELLGLVSDPFRNVFNTL
ncbi:MAG: pepF, partial [Chloroflexi bacterium]|nr:pepF [Chloroflexota bacterium]